MSASNENEVNVEPTYLTEGGFGTDGSGSVSRTVSFSGGTPTGPGFSWTGTLTVPAGNSYSISVSADDSATVSGEGVSAESHWDASAKVVVPGSATSDFRELPEGAGDVTFSISYTNLGGPYSLSAKVISKRRPTNPEMEDGDEKCSCSGRCDMASETNVRSVSFRQPFGRTPYAAGFAAGTLVLKKAAVDEELFSPAGLKYDHLLTRRVTAKDHASQSATVSADGLWENVYEGGAPDENNAWKSSRVRVNEDGTVVERLSDRMEISYGADGAFVSAKSPEGVVLTAAQLGVEVVRDAETGALRQIWSLADGLLDVVSTGEASYEIRWYKNGDFSDRNAAGLYVPTGTPVKVFECGAPAGTTNKFSLTERRGLGFAFVSTWTFSPQNGEWVLERGDALTISRSWTKNEAGNFVVTETKTAAASDAPSASVSVSSEEISPANGNRFVGKSVGGVAEYT
ncbi:MAG: hypothetical protein ACI4P3_02670, partial [Candidatus Spyradosoma sp.]